MGRTICTEVTVEQQRVTLLLGDAAVAGLDTCPLCGNKLSSNLDDQVRPQLRE